MTTTSAVPFSPLTTTELHARQDAAAWLAVSSLTFHDRYPAVGTLEDDAVEAIKDARRANEFHEAAMARTS
jgi:hypothetical protein